MSSCYSSLMGANGSSFGFASLFFYNCSLSSSASGSSSAAALLGLSSAGYSLASGSAFY